MNIIRGVNMGFVQKLKDIFGIGGIKVKFDVSDTFNKEDSAISGKVIVTTKSEKTVSGLEFKFEEVWQTGRGEDKSSKTYELGTCILDEEFTINPGETKEFAFDLPFQLLKSKNDELAESAGKVGKALGGLGKMMDAEKSNYWLHVSANIKGTVFPPTDTMELKLNK